LRDEEVIMTIATRNVALWLVVGVLVRPGVCAAQDVELWKSRAGQIPIGATVKLRTNDGHRMRAVLMGVDESGILVKPATRVPEPSRRLPFDRLEVLERFEDRVSFPKYIATGAAIAGSLFVMLLVSVQ
jgi:hypothetical protein